MGLSSQVHIAIVLSFGWMSSFVFGFFESDADGMKSLNQVVQFHQNHGTEHEEDAGSSVPDMLLRRFHRSGNSEREDVDQIYVHRVTRFGSVLHDSHGKLCGTLPDATLQAQPSPYLHPCRAQQCSV